MILNLQSADRSAYDDIGHLKTARGEDAAGGAGAILLEQFGYDYDKAWNLNYRTNNAMIECHWHLQ
ncbi:MAG TPA: hypothetical protein VH280_10660 [Verrucomicrobiae bacterium]|nr:hypothetical protein [Verrucomicrobiae bacterium]